MLCQLESSSLFMGIMILSSIDFLGFYFFCYDSILVNLSWFYHLSKRCYGIFKVELMDFFFHLNIKLSLGISESARAELKASLLLSSLIWGQTPVPTPLTSKLGLVLGFVSGEVEHLS